MRVTERLWTLTPAGLDVAAVVLEREPREMGGTAKAAAASGAKHARAVTDVLAALLQTPPEPTLPVVRQHQLVPARTPPADTQPSARPDGLGPLNAWSTEAALPVAGAFLRGSGRADAVFALHGHVQPWAAVRGQAGYAIHALLVAVRVAGVQRWRAAPAGGIERVLRCGGGAGRDRRVPGEKTITSREGRTVLGAVLPKADRPTPPCHVDACR
ncbi:hypothetical protein [Streptomyces sp. JNUCC 63]